MMGFGFLSMLLVIALPIVAVVALIVWLSNPNRQGNPFNMNPPTGKGGQFENSEMNRFCSHCGTGLQDSWAHCPQCGVPVES